MDPDTAGSGFRTADPRALAYGFAHLYLEVECGRRPARQLAALMDPGLHARLELVWVRLHQPLATIRHVHATQQDRKIDAVVVVQRGRRVGAIALELSWIAGRWYVTAAVRPEDGPLPPAPFTVPAGDVLEAVPGCEGLGGDGRQPDGRLEQRPGTDAPAALVAPAA